MERTISTDDLKAKLDSKDSVKVVVSVEHSARTNQRTRAAVVARQGC